MTTCVLIAGTFRSGTSALGGILHRLGVDMNPKDKSLDNPVYNPTGSYQDVYLWPQYEPLDLVGYFDKRDFTKPFIGIKSHVALFDPEFPKFIETLKTKVDRCVLIRTRRDNKESLDSYRFVSGINVTLMSITRQENIIQSIYNTWRKEDKLDINFKDIVFNPKEVALRICRELNIEYIDECCDHIKPEISKFNSVEV